MTRLLRVARNVADTAAAAEFYAALGFTVIRPAAEDAALAAVLGVERVRSLRMGLGAQQLELTQCTPCGAAYPVEVGSLDVRFQHIAIMTLDIFELQRRALAAKAAAISFQGPQQLPAESGGATAWKFRDPEGHPLEFLQPPDASAPPSGYDHSAIGVIDAARSIRFYQALGLTLAQRHRNHGAAQARLDGLAQSVVEVIAMMPADAPPHVELLAYEGAVTGGTVRPHDIAADRLVFSGASGPVLQQDPDGHFLLRDGRD